MGPKEAMTQGHGAHSARSNSSKLLAWKWRLKVVVGPTGGDLNFSPISILASVAINLHLPNPLEARLYPRLSAFHIARGKPSPGDLGFLAAVGPLRPCRGCLICPRATPRSFNPQEYFSPTYRSAEPSPPTEWLGPETRAHHLPQEDSTRRGSIAEMMRDVTEPAGMIPVIAVVTAALAARRR